MASLYLLIPIAIILVCVAVGIFIWAVRNEQFEDLERQGYDILFDENDPIKKPTKTTSSKEKHKDEH
ncbi:cytochrome oxidase maturation protein Cbb3 [Photobacterium aquae]|uniref:Cytochrome oxidase maturation protein Cbb3 n=1 Tax=Photobacterium aquae TaxID=1195763 RepID=A0A0J1H6E4_9GAMM|nr:cbb3-type cytochrome oxidase assembly protein CcoS [Photobacterium aquae]KLV07279.1 cytochrome oxidase maturation protein Cbb3 [Photobacterium aquae]